MVQKKASGKMPKSAKPKRLARAQEEREKSRGDTAQQEEREIRGVLPLRLSYSKFTVDGPTLQKRRDKKKGHRKKKLRKRTFLFP